MGAWLVVVLLAAGCVDVRIERLRTGPAPATIGVEEGLGAEEVSLTILTRRQSVTGPGGADFAECLGSELDGDEFALYPQRPFRDLLFPWFEPRVAPRTVHALDELLKDPVRAERLRASEVRYIVWIEGSTHRPDPEVMWPGAVSWEQALTYEASVWDVREGSAVGRLHLEANGTSYVLVTFVPVPLIARTEATACDRLAGAVRGLLRASSTVGLASPKPPKLAPRFQFR